MDNLRKVEGMTSITYSVNKENTNVIMGKNIRLLWGTDLYYRLYRECEISDFSAFFLSGESETDGKFVSVCVGLCRVDR